MNLTQKDVEAIALLMAENTVTKAKAKVNDDSEKSVKIMETMFIPLCVEVLECTIQYHESRTENLTFEEALVKLKEGAKVARRLWFDPNHDAGIFIFDNDIVQKDIIGELISYIADTDDLLATDWYVVTEPVTH